jgi:fructokinase
MIPAHPGNASSRRAGEAVRARFGGVEAGGTKFVLGIGSGPGAIEAQTTIPTTTPAETLDAVIRWFRSQEAIDALGIACFGPVERDRRAQDWGFITATTKAGWSHTDVAPALARALGVPVGFDTDVNGAALAEARWGATRGCRVSVYVTVGTGIGGGTVIDGAPFPATGHPEMGHLRLPRHPDDTAFKGVCPFHGDCLEGLASGPAIMARWGASLSTLSPDHPAHAIIAWYLGQFAVTIQALLAPERIVLGGGVLKARGLLDRICEAAASANRGYFAGDIRNVLVAPGLGEASGLLGAFDLAETALKTAGQSPTRGLV